MSRDEDRAPFLPLKKLNDIVLARWRSCVSVEYTAIADDALDCVDVSSSIE
ncbi:MAG: hypothetical protein IH827_00545 [Myxococcales bacterium]|nr:hypothetical protein [Myxococcales bacterium]